MLHNATAINASPSLERRGLNREEAAYYLGVSPGTLDKLVNEGRMPAPVPFGRRRVWDKRALDRLLDLHAGIELTGGSEAEESPLDAWRRANGRN